MTITTQEKLVQLNNFYKWLETLKDEGTSKYLVEEVQKTIERLVSEIARSKNG